MVESVAPPIFRFAPSPNGALHLGHAYCALLNARMAAGSGGRFLLRIDDIDTTRCKREYEIGILEDLGWLGLTFPQTPRRQCEHVDDYDNALAALAERGLLYPCFCTRTDILRSGAVERDPDGSPLYGGVCRALSPAQSAARLAAGERAALRLDMSCALALAPAPLTWREFGEGVEPAVVAAAPAAWGDVVIRGKDQPASYHLAVVVDDAAQGVSDVVRGADLFAATSVHRLLQALLRIEPPRYRHHRLVREANGAKMSKSAVSTALSALRAAGIAPAEIRAALGFGPAAATRLAVTVS